MVTWKNLAASALVAIVLAVVGVTALMSAINPSADEVAATTSGNDPLTPPDFYGTR